jgi:UDP:flavonoid glycosyltransferase YjiC (YdhE family)
MINSTSSNKRPLVGFFPLFYNLAETGRAVLVAKRYIEHGGQAIFFSHGGEYEKLARDLGCKVVKVDPIYSKEFIDDLWKYSRLEKTGAPFPEKMLREHVEAELAAYKQTGVELILTTNNFSCSISTRAAGIPLISITPKVIGKFTKYPDDAEFFLTRFIPKSLKLKVLNWYFPRSKIWSRPFNKLAKNYDLPGFHNSSDITKGDYTLYTDFLELLQLSESDATPSEFYIGPIFLDELFNKTLPEEQSGDKIKQHLQKPGKSILFSLGSSGTKEFFLKVLTVLNKTNYNVIAVYASVLSEDELPVVNDNIILKKFVPSIKELNHVVDLAILHGGQGTVYTAAYAGKPVIGFPMQFEQHLNLEVLVKHGMARIESRRYFKEQLFLKTIEDVFDNYDVYLKNAQKLASRLPKPEGDKNAAEILLNVIDQGM